MKFDAIPILAFQKHITEGALQTHHVYTCTHHELNTQGGKLSRFLKMGSGVVFR